MLRSTLLLALFVAITTASTAPHKLYIQYVKKYGPNFNSQSAREFCRYFVHSLHRPVPEIDVLLGKEKTALLQPKREMYQVHCKGKDPFSSRWMREQFEEITKNQLFVTEEMMMGLWEAFRKLPCSCYVDYDHSVFGKTFSTVFDVGITVDSRFNKAYELLLSFDEHLRRAKNLLSPVPITRLDKVQLALDAIEKNYLTGLRDKEKSAHMRTFLLTEKFASDSELNLIKKELQAKQAEIVAAAPLLSHKLYLGYVEKYGLDLAKNTKEYFCRSFVHSLHQPVPEIDALLGEEKTALLQPKRESYQKYCKDQDPFSSPWMTAQFEGITKDQSVVTEEMMLGLWEAFRKLPCPSYVNYDLYNFGQTFSTVFDVGISGNSKFNKSIQLADSFDQHLSRAIRLVSWRKITREDKVQLALDAIDKNYLTVGSDEEKAAHMRTFLLTEKFASGSLNSIKKELQAKQAETVKKKLQPKQAELQAPTAIYVPPLTEQLPSTDEPSESGSAKWKKAGAILVTGGVAILCLSVLVLCL